MKIIISPAKKMRIENNLLQRPCTEPAFLAEQQALYRLLAAMDREALQALWQCNDAIADQNIERLAAMPVTPADTPALLAYEGIQYQSMGPAVFTDAQWDYVQAHLRILSGFYGCLRPLDGVMPYRLEMQARLPNAFGKNLYAFWGDKLYRALCDGEDCIVNLASKEYSKAIEKYLTGDVRFLTCVFGEEKEGRVRVKATQAKMARGEMVRFMAEKAIEDPQELKTFDRMGFAFSPGHSSETAFVFLRKDS